MPKIRTQRFNKAGPTGERLEFASEVSVDGDGIFSFTIPDELAGTARTLVERQPGLSVDKAVKNWRVKGSDLQRCEAFVTAAMIDYLAATETREKVIIFNYSAQTVFARAEDGSIHPTAHAATEATGSKAAEWVQPVSARYFASYESLPEYSIGLAARVVWKVTHTRPSGSKVVFERCVDGDHFEMNPTNRLNSWKVKVDERPEHRHEMPYSDEAALFFDRMLVSLCRLGEQMVDFLSDRERLMLAIERGSGLLPAPARAEAAA